MNDRNDFEVERALRDSLGRHARQAPPADLLAERIIHAAGRTDGAPAARRRPGRSWRTWSLPVLAAASVAAVVVGVSVAGNLHHDASHTPPATISGNRGSSTTTATTHPAPEHSTSHSGQPVGPGTNTSTLHAFRATDLTFVGSSNGWALGTANCLTSAGRCTAMMYTTDGGATWHSMTGPAADVGSGCTGPDPCVAHVRFANDKVGYAYGDSAFFMTLDGGAHWGQQPGGALAVETLDGNVIRVTSAGSGCPGPCNVQVQTAPIGSADWTTADLPRAATVETDGVGPLVRSGSKAYLLFTGHTAGGAQSATSTLYVSGDDGTHWTSVGEPCPQPARGERDSTTIAAAPDGTVFAGCVNRMTQAASIAVSDNGGATWALRSAFSSAGLSMLAAASGQDLLAMSDVLYRSSDGGAHFTKVQQNSQGPLGGAWIGFESDRDGHVLDTNGSTLWATTDAGAHWTSFTFP